MGDVVKRAYKYRFYPSPEQAEQLGRTFGCVRLVYNRALEARTRAWAVDRRRTTYAQSSGWLTEWKRTQELAFLNEVSSVPLQQTLRHLQAGFVAFWDKRARYPRFKSKRKSRASAEYTRSAFRWRDGQLTLAKMNTPLDIVWSRPLPEGAEPSTVTVSRDAAGRWFVSILIEDPTVKTLPPVAAVVGVDAGITSLLTLSHPIPGISDEHGKVANPRYGQTDRRKLAKAQQNLARKQKGSANRAKARLRVARIHARIADRRRDNLHKLTTRLVRETQTVAIEDLSVRNMLRNRRLARVISDAGWGQFRSMLEYKAQWYGRQVIPINRWLPTSKTCSACGRINTTLELNDRSWTCPGCKAEHDRDINAAKNILAAGLAER
ncbi:RNA-guided endonuclease InsQ/TnpB family protein [Micromonospora sp. NPDC047740]|uniref:RNA-guided endonuclease InsQ/TnpB family protein n=1 Tax=Micromonospora sp. NPDC047740 TaxID=3364254 RepID=UPI003718931A